MFEYHRNTHRQPIGCFVAQKMNDEEVRYGWSLCCKKDKFNKRFGLQLAFNRVEKYDVDAMIKKIPESMIDQFCRFTQRAARYFKKTDVPVLTREVIKDAQAEEILI